MERWIGRWNWQPPFWLVWVGSRLVRDSRLLAMGGLVLAVVIAGWLWLRSRPSPHYVTFTVASPGLTEYGDKGISSIKPLAIQFSEPAAPLQQVEKTVVSGIEMSPRMGGTWRWVSDRKLEFSPKG